MIAAAAALTLLLGAPFVNASPRTFPVADCSMPDGTVGTCRLVLDPVGSLLFRTRHGGIVRIDARVQVRAPDTNREPAYLALATYVDQQMRPLTQTTLWPGTTTAMRVRASVRLSRGLHRLRVVLTPNGNRPDEVVVERVRLASGRC